MDRRHPTPITAAGRPIWGHRESRRRGQSWGFLASPAGAAYVPYRVGRLDGAGDDSESPMRSGGALMRITVALVLFGVLAGAAARAQETSTPSPALLVLHKGENAMAIVDPSNGQVVGHVPTGQDPHELAVSDDGRLAFASNYAGPGPRGGNSLSVIDIAGRKELHRVEISPLSRPHGLWFADGKLYFTAEGSMAIARYDPSSNKVDWLLGLGQDRTHMILVAKDQKTIFTSNVSSNTISIIERAGPPQGRPGGPGGFPGGRPPGGPGGPPPGAPDGPPPGGPGGPPPGGSGGPGGPPSGGPGGGPGWRQTLVPVGRGPEGFDVSPDGKELWTAHMGDGKIAVIDVAARKVVQTIDAGGRAPNRLKFTPDGKLALVSELGGGGLIVLDVGTRTVMKRVPLGRGASGILIPPEGGRAYVALTGSNTIAVIDLESLAEVARFRTGSGPDGMAWLPAKPK
jgi:YVTN family beta-propeller protein